MCEHGKCLTLWGSSLTEVDFLVRNSQLSGTAMIESKAGWRLRTGHSSELLGCEAGAERMGCDLDRLRTGMANLMLGPQRPWRRHAAPALRLVQLCAATGLTMPDWCVILAAETVAATVARSTSGSRRLPKFAACPSCGGEGVVGDLQVKVLGHLELLITETGQHCCFRMEVCDARSEMAG
jgi:hypothetical protein